MFYYIYKHSFWRVGFSVLVPYPLYPCYYKKTSLFLQNLIHENLSFKKMVIEWSEKYVEHKSVFALHTSSSIFGTIFSSIFGTIFSCIFVISPKKKNVQRNLILIKTCVEEGWTEVNLTFIYFLFYYVKGFKYCIRSTGRFVVFYYLHLQIMNSKFVQK